MNCACGCGRLTTVPTETNRKLGRIRGVPMQYVHGHNGRGHRNGRWRGGRQRHNEHYILVHRPGHNRADRHGYVREHWLIAEAAHGKPLPNQAVVHHHNRADPRALVVCEDQSYHMLIEYRTKALRASGHANWRKCQFCKRWDDQANLYTRPPGKSGSTSYHRACRRTYEALLKARHGRAA